jgi:hypothetical protein
LVIFGAFSWQFSCGGFETFLFGIWWGCMHKPFVVLFPLIPQPNPLVKGLNFGVLIVLGFVVFLAEILRFLLIQRVLVDQIIAMGCPWGTPSIPKVLCESVEWNGRSGSGFEEVDPQLVVHPELPRLDRSDWCKALVGFASGNYLVRVIWPVVLIVSSWLVWSCFARFCEGFSSGVGCVLEGFFVPRPMGVTEAFWNFVVHQLFDTGLTGRAHRSNRFHRSDPLEPSVWPVWPR